MDGRARALIVGAGIAGLATANALERIGLVPQIVERARTLRPPGLGLAMMPNGVRSLDAIGLGELVRARGIRQDRAARVSASGDSLGELDLAAGAERFGPTIALHRDDLIGALTAKLSAAVRLGTTVEGLEPTSSALGVRFSDGSRGEFDLVVGADGLRSQIGPLVFGDPALAYRGYRAWRTVLPRRSSDPDHVVFHLAPRTFVGTFPVRRDALYLFALEHGPDDDASSSDGHGHLRRLAERFDGLGGAAVERLTPEVPVLYTPVYEVVRDRWVTDRVALVGDAAHAIVPFQAQGAAQAVEDAVALASALQASGEVDRALQDFFERRRDRVATVRNACRFLGQLTGLEGPLDPSEIARHPGNLGEPARIQEVLWTPGAVQAGGQRGTEAPPGGA